MIIKTGTIGEWNTSTPQYYAATPGAKDNRNRRL